MRFGKAPVNLPLVAALAALIAIASPARGATVSEQMARLRSDEASRLYREARKRAGKKEYFVLVQLVEIGLSFDPDHRDLEKFRGYYAFVPPLPDPPVSITADNLPDSNDLRRRKPDRDACVRAISAFFAGDLDLLLMGYLDRLKALRGDPDELSEGVGREVFRLFALARKRNWTGEIARRGCRIDGFVAAGEVLLRDLGWERRRLAPDQDDARWFSPDDIEGGGNAEVRARELFYKTRRAVVKRKLEALPEATGIEKVAGVSEFESGLGKKLTKVRSAHFRVECPFDGEAAKQCLSVQEAGFAVLLRFLGMKDPGRFDQPVLSVILPTERLYSRYVWDMRDDPDDEKKWTVERTTGTPDKPRKAWVGIARKLDERLRDRLVCCTAGFVMGHLGFKERPLWVRRGLEAALTLEVLGTADTSFVSSESTTGKADGYRWFNYYWWRYDLARAERRGLAPSTDSVLSRNNVNELIPMQRAKMYGLVVYMIKTDPARFRKLLERMALLGWKRDAAGEFPALSDAGWSLKALDEGYRGDLIGN